MKIPVSRLFRDYHHHSQLLEKNRSLLEAHGSKEINTKILRDLMENVNIANAKVDALTNSINESYKKSLIDWSAEELAYVLTGLDVRLFMLLCPRDSFTGLKEFTDFQDYLKIIIENELLDLGEAESLVRIEMLIKTGFFCIYVYRNLSSGKTLVSLVDCWMKKMNLGSKVSSKLLLLQNHLNEMIESIKKLESDMLFHHQKLNEISVIPNAMHIKDGFEEIYSLCVAHSSVESGVILSGQGQAALQSLISLVECCQGKVRNDYKLSNQEMKNVLPKLDFQIPCLPCKDLKSLGIGNLILEHWLLTRVLKQDDSNIAS